MSVPKGKPTCARELSGHRWRSMPWQAGVVKVWRTRDGFLAKYGGDFIAVSPEGLVVRWFGSRAYSDEDDLWRWQHLVIGNGLYERTTVERGPVVTKSEDQLVVDSLVSIEDRHVTELVEKALATDRDAREQETLRAERAGDARVAAIVGGLRDGELGPELVRAREALEARVRAYDDRVAARLLGTFVLVARVRPGPGVESAYARGCLAACFQSAADEPDGGPAGTPPQEPQAALEAELALRAAELEQEAEYNEYIDASRTATAYFRAAAAVREAARGAAGKG